MTMMVSYLISGLIGFLFFSSTVDATARETMEVKVFDPTLSMSDQKMLERLKEVDLESHGYKVEKTTKLVKEPGSGTSVYKKSVLYYKVVDCSRLREIDQELQTLLPDIFRQDLVQKINSEITSKDLIKMKQCRVGLQVHFKQGCSDQKKNVRRRKRGCFICLFCWNAKLAN